MNTFDTPTTITAVVEIPAGRVQLIAADRSDTTVEVRPMDASKDRDVKAAERTTVHYYNGVLRVGLLSENKLLSPSGAVEVTIQLPAGSRVEGKAAAAELRTVGRLGDVTFDGAYQWIKLDEAASLRLTAVDGDVEVGRLTGPSEITTARGDIRIGEAASGATTCRTSLGEVLIGALS